MSSQTSLTGAAGEYFVMSELLRRGYIAALAPVGVPNADIVVTDIRGNKLAAIQVKARRHVGGDGGWHMSKKHETITSDNIFYCFVDFGKQPADVFVLPSAVVAKVLRDAHAKWLATPGKGGRPHNDGPMRRLTPTYENIFGDVENHYALGWLEQYRDGWEKYLGDAQEDPDSEVA